MKPEVPVDREQGKVQEDEQIQANAPAPIEPTPAQADEAMLEGVVQNAGVEQPAQQTEQPAYTVRNPNLLLPASVNYRRFAQQRPTPTEVEHNLGLFWQVMADSPGASELTRNVARGLLRNRTNGTQG
jgi:hypothetical protein